MTRYILRRLMLLPLVLLGVSVIVFSMLHFLPGDPAEVMLGEIGATGEAIARLREQLGLNDPLHVQYGRYLWRALHGDLGESTRTRRPVTWYVATQLPSTIELTVAGMGLAILVGVLSGVVAAVHHNRWADWTTMLGALVGVSIPNFWLGIMLVLLFSYHLGWVPATGAGGFSRLALPMVALALPSAAVVARLTRSSMLEAMRQEYVVTARAKGLHERVVIFRHVLRNALIPVTTVVGLQFGNLLGGAVTIETVFARRGVGRLMVDAILARDFPMVQGMVLMAAVIYVLSNLAVDVLYAFLDPRIRY